ncbi:hypothetical protein ACS0TY_014424 [Phlomoides rotata]
MICCREAINMMRTQRQGGHIFNIDGAGLLYLCVHWMVEKTCLIIHTKAAQGRIFVDVGLGRIGA